MSKFGPIKSLVIPRPSEVTSSQDLIKPKYPKESLLKAYVEFEKLSNAFVAFNLMEKWKYNDWELSIIFYDYDSFIKWNLK